MLLRLPSFIHSYHSLSLSLSLSGKHTHTRAVAHSWISDSYLNSLGKQCLSCASHFYLQTLSDTEVLWDFCRLLDPYWTQRYKGIEKKVTWRNRSTWIIAHPYCWSPGQQPTRSICPVRSKEFCREHKDFLSRCETGPTLFFCVSFFW